jgi:hypothetical protein
MPAAPDPHEPKEADYATYEAFIEARADYRARRAYHEEREADRRATEQREAQTAVERQRQTVAERIEAFAKDHPDYEEVVSNPSLILTPAIAYALQHSDDGPAMAYALAKDPARFQRIAALAPPETMMELGLLRAELRQAPGSRPASTPKLPAAPPPPTTVRGGSVAAPLSLDDLAKRITPGDSQTSEWLRRRNEELAKRGLR